MWREDERQLDKEGHGRVREGKHYTFVDENKQWYFEVKNLDLCEKKCVDWKSNFLEDIKKKTLSIYVCG